MSKKYKCVTCNAVTEIKIIQKPLSVFKGYYKGAGWDDTRYPDDYCPCCGTRLGGPCIEEIKNV
jgi:hypothetical protein